VKAQGNTVAYKPRLQEKYEKEVRPALMEQFGLRNIMQAPRLVKVCVNMGVGDAKSGPEAGQNMEAAVRELARIVGQRPSVTRARRSISQFGVRKGMTVGCRATLRGARAWEFLDRLFSVALPRIRDFRGLPRNSFDGRGNYSLGITDHLIFPELNYDDVLKQRGMDITIVTTAGNDEMGRAMLEGLGLPFQRSEG
jgi:large subunit ribosomal protein L5